MIVKNARKLTAVLLMSLTWISTTNSYAAVVKTPTDTLENEVLPPNGFPEQLNALMELPGKKDLIEIPMQEPFAAKEFVEYLSYESDYGINIRDAFIEMSPAHNGVVTAKLKTTGRSLDIPVRDVKTNYYYSYSVGNGYVFSTKVSIPISMTGYSGSLKIEYLQKKIDQYLISQGYTNTTSTLGKLFDSYPTYEKGDISVKIDTEGFKPLYFIIKSINKNIDKNSKAISEATIQKDIELEYKSLDNILEKK
jgi:hypothetical protein